MTKRKKMTHRWGMRARRMERGVASREAKAERKRAQSHSRACTPDPPPSARVARSAGKWALQRAFELEDLIACAP